MEQLPKNPSILVEVFSMIKERKKWWLFPLLILIILAGILIIVTHGSAAVSPFIYPLF